MSTFEEKLEQLIQAINESRLANNKVQAIVEDIKRNHQGECESLSGKEWAIITENELLDHFTGE